MVNRPNYSLAILNLRPHYRTHKVLQIFFLQPSLMVYEPANWTWKRTFISRQYFKKKIFLKKKKYILTRGYLMNDINVNADLSLLKTYSILKGQSTA